VVQYEAAFDERWHAIVRYDTAHGFPHRDLLHPRKATEKRPMMQTTLNLAFSFAIQDIRQLWETYRAEYERELGHGA
jgi:hypothetical protein